ncbi:hypothetical protein BCR33DRAFT_788264 [Rhizoclosmatium globosum]|uniref:Myb-like domain-containing protein n=1 Tax=Rhizoclosmatium globosum TaxID=329046 RepID=A0A1Y2BY05_9FUNG|nr:hypothetical protein BCR33DRAFT_788264 [Rhizoclosmatium globosum]|eukprot:ORY39641.1 hypothetical protein BCR33DRAFT_788264 [Rhizoclosmatium globosum]
MDPRTTRSTSSKAPAAKAAAKKESKPKPKSKAASPPKPASKKSQPPPPPTTKLALLTEPKAPRSNIKESVEVIETNCAALVESILFGATIDSNLNKLFESFHTNYAMAHCLKAAQDNKRPDFVSKNQLIGFQVAYLVALKEYLLQRNPEHALDPDDVVAASEAVEQIIKTLDSCDVDKTQDFYFLRTEIQTCLFALQCIQQGEELDPDVFFASPYENSKKKDKKQMLHLKILETKRKQITKMFAQGQGLEELSSFEDVVPTYDDYLERVYEALYYASKEGRDVITPAASTVDITSEFKKHIAQKWAPKAKVASPTQKSSGSNSPSKKSSSSNPSTPQKKVVPVEASNSAKKNSPASPPKKRVLISEEEEDDDDDDDDEDVEAIVRNLDTSKAIENGARFNAKNRAKKLKTSTPAKVVTTGGPSVPAPLQNGEIFIQLGTEDEAENEFEEDAIPDLPQQRQPRQQSPSNQPLFSPSDEEEAQEQPGRKQFGLTPPRSSVAAAAATMTASMNEISHKVTNLTRAFRQTSGRSPLKKVSVPPPNTVLPDQPGPSNSASPQHQQQSSPSVNRPPVITATMRATLNQESTQLIRKSAISAQHAAPVLQQAYLARKDGPRATRGRKKWTSVELAALMEGMRIYGTKWNKIAEMHDEYHTGILKDRGQVDLKDKARNEYARRLKKGEDLGVFSLVHSERMQQFVGRGLGLDLVFEGGEDEEEF